MGRIWILEEHGDCPDPDFKWPLEWNLIINFSTEQRSREFKILSITNYSGDGENTLNNNPIPKMGFDEWF